MITKFLLPVLNSSMAVLEELLADDDDDDDGSSNASYLKLLCPKR